MDLDFGGVKILVTQKIKRLNNIPIESIRSGPGRSGILTELVLHYGTAKAPRSGLYCASRLSVH